MTSAAGRLNTPATIPPADATLVPGAAVSAGGSASPRSRRRLTKYPDHPTATVAPLSAYSRIRSHPMIHATSSPTDA
jgi:hypothetical protein